MFTDILNSFHLEPGIIQICLRFLCAMLVGLVIGTEREYTNRPAGMRTHVLVALGACTVALTGQMIFGQYSPLGATPDPGRLAAQVITGVGFLGAGTILREGTSVKGLTTAASVWTVACLGIAAGFGYYPIALCGMVFMLITLTILEFFQHRLPGRGTSRQDYTLICQDLTAALELLDQQAHACKGQLQSILAQRQDEAYVITFQATFHNKKQQNRFFTTIASAAGITSLQQRKEPV